MRKKILVLAHSPYIGGAELALAGLIESTKDLYDWHLVFASNVKAKDRLIKYAKYVDYLDLTWWCHEAHDSPRRLARKRMEKAVHKLEALAKTADYLLTNTITVPWLGFIAPKVGKPHIWYVHEFGDIDHNLQFILGYEESLRFISESSSRVLTISTAVKEHLARIIPSERIDIIHQSIDATRLSALPAQSTPLKPKRLLCMGAIKPSKGQHIAAEAVRLLSGSVSLDIIGPAADPAFVEKLRHEVVGFSNINIDVRTYDIVKELSTHDTVLMCSSNEALGRVTLESLAAGKLVIGYACTATKEILADNRGLVYQPNTSEALAETIRKSEKQLSSIDIQENRNYVAEMYSPARQAKDFATSLVNADNEPLVDSGFSWPQYIEVLHAKSLLLNKAGEAKVRARKLASKVLPASTKQAIRQNFRR